MSGHTSTGLVWGDNTASNADNSAVHATIDGDTLTAGNQTITIALNETITLAGTVNFSGIASTTGSVQFRAGLYNTNGSSNTAGWLGYMFGNPTQTTNGTIFERVSGEYFSGTKTIQAGTTSLTGGTGNLTDGLYNFSLSLKRVSTSMEITSSLVRQSDGANFAKLTTSPFVDTTASTFAFNRIGFLAGGSLDADRLTLSNLSITVIPEPSGALLGGLGILVLLRRRRA